MIGKLFTFSDHNKCLNLTKLVPPTALTASQTRFLLDKTRANSKHYFEARTEMSVETHIDRVRYWALKARKSWTMKIFESLKKYQENYDIDLPVCSLVTLCFTMDLLEIVW